MHTLKKIIQEHINLLIIYTICTRCEDDLYRIELYWRYGDRSASELAHTVNWLFPIKFSLGTIILFSFFKTFHNFQAHCWFSRMLRFWRWIFYHYMTATTFFNLPDIFGWCLKESFAEVVLANLWYEQYGCVCNLLYSSKNHPLLTKAPASIDQCFASIKYTEKSW